MDFIVEANTPLPLTRTRDLQPDDDFAGMMDLEIYEGKFKECDKNNFKGSLKIRDLPEELREDVNVRVEIHIDSDFNIDVKAKCLETGKIT